eukprot:TRINITY_DN970_c0_g1_i1.p2 TRINITY_DN970_c0_g1~~TRINITY_DN970_c0_g1_i1.p2  ORF type:complete len:370 (-),score=53.71 TRINITY_DN970_c0_g1_i1:4275-5384(-)
MGANQEKGKEAEKEEEEEEDDYGDEYEDDLDDPEEKKAQQKPKRKKKRRAKPVQKKEIEALEAEPSEDEEEAKIDLLPELKAEDLQQDSQPGTPSFCPEHTVTEFPQINEVNEQPPLDSKLSLKSVHKSKTLKEPEKTEEQFEEDEPNEEESVLAPSKTLINEEEYFLPTIPKRNAYKIRTKAKRSVALVPREKDIVRIIKDFSQWRVNYESTRKAKQKLSQERKKNITINQPVLRRPILPYCNDVGSTKQENKPLSIRVIAQYNEDKQQQPKEKYRSNFLQNKMVSKLISRAVHGTPVNTKKSSTLIPPSKPKVLLLTNTEEKKVNRRNNSVLMHQSGKKHYYHLPSLDKTQHIISLNQGIVIKLQMC